MHVAGAACHCGLLVCLNILVVVIDKGVWNAFPVFQSVTESSHAILRTRTMQFSDT